LNLPGKHEYHSPVLRVSPPRQRLHGTGTSPGGKKTAALKTPKQQTVGLNSLTLDEQKELLSITLAVMRKGRSVKELLQTAGYTVTRVPSER